MPTNDDMTTPVTRRDLDEILDQRLGQLRIDLRAEIVDLRAEIAADTRATNAALLEDAYKRFRVIDDQYKDLPDRVAKLERKVFPPPRRKRAG